MALTKFTKDMNYISSLSDRPNETDGLTSNELKERFDRAGREIKDFLNNSLIDELDEEFDKSFVQSDDDRLSNSRRCNNTFDNWSIARTNLKISYGNSLPNSADNGTIFLLYK